MHYFIFTFKIYLDSVYIADGKIGKITLLSVINDEPVKVSIIKHFTHILKPDGNLTVQISNVRKVYQDTFEQEAVDFIEL